MLSFSSQDSISSMKPECDALSHKEKIAFLPEKELLQHSITYSKENDLESMTCTTSSGSSREKWGKEIEFLLSCIALSVGLGNVWRFPFIALENGGGAFVIPYIIVLLLIGRPVYYMEVIIGQFSSRGCIEAFDMAPIMRGIAYGQVYATALATTYYACIMAITIKYLIASFSFTLPWTHCRPEWGPQCIDSTEIELNNQTEFTNRTSSAEIYFTKGVLREKHDINDGIGTPNWDLVLCLAAAWLIIGTTLVKGIRSSGKASYFLAIFPYFVMIILLFRAITLPGSIDGIIYFLKPQWNQLLNAKVWYAAITQMFFSLAICFGTLVMYASYNNFRKNVYRDVIIITTVDSLTSILAGCIIFGILGNLAYETKANDISKVVQGGAGLAFISYPDAIAKFKYFPQAFAVLFFLMLLVLGIGSNIGMTSCVITVIKDRFNHLPHWLLATSISLIGFGCGIVYLTPGGQFILNLVDFFGCSFIALFLAIAELISVAWIYGVKRFCQDIEFMFNIKTGFYWRICWGILTPGLMFLVLAYTVVTYKPLDYKGITYPKAVYQLAWIIWGIGVGQLPIWGFYAVYKQPGKTWTEKVKGAMEPTHNWGPLEPKIRDEYRQYRAELGDERPLSLWEQFYDNVFG
ncbi:sodium-dependent nutrient amino acid transporter 1 isoform X1 [Eupeodes corollae]|uniref:sodium-dependent nutrient amino acid transporter 1 isoform X1 n=2 Tax=Eupeodes corollae TaxID=290404 RepID=UPI002492915B|nr:sodium-dependent nutrient amino acid transporter 1 isoform X1 [Eupeodes corollae]